MLENLDGWQGIRNKFSLHIHKYIFVYTAFLEHLAISLIPCRVSSLILTKTLV
jgi:hypothetical protein